jgi:hypothetical protein
MIILAVTLPPKHSGMSLNPPFALVDDILSLIFQHVPSADRPDTATALQSCMSVCKTWNVRIHFDLASV